MKKRYIFLAVVFSICFTGCQQWDPAEHMFSHRNNDKTLEQQDLNITKVDLTEEEINELLFMREEEKLAHDVYFQFYALYSRTIFLNIYESEQNHTDAVLKLLDFYGIEDPAEGKEIGEFFNLDLQSLYDSLYTAGQAGLISALEVGVFIELTDIDEINEAIAATQVINIIQVYTHLLEGSQKHLEAFLNDLEKVENKPNH